MWKVCDWLYHLVFGWLWMLQPITKHTLPRTNNTILKLTWVMGVYKIYCSNIECQIIREVYRSLESNPQCVIFTFSPTSPHGYFVTNSGLMDIEMYKDFHKPRLNVTSLGHCTQHSTTTSTSTYEHKCRTFKIKKFIKIIPKYLYLSTISILTEPNIWWSNHTPLAAQMP